MYFLLTNDVEEHSILLNRCEPKIAKEIYEVGLPRLLDLLSKHGVQSTFYFTGVIAETSPESIELVKSYGYEIGCHGYSHLPEKALDLLSYEEQVNELKKAKNVIEKVAGKIESFRAPMLRINEYTVKALEETGFTSDSSICSQRFDGPFTFGTKKKLKWLFAPRKPYFLSSKSIIRRGDSKILEIPISALISPFIGTTMRIAPSIIKALQKYLFLEAKKTNKPIVFSFHPNECLDLDTHDKIAPARRTNKVIEYLFADKLRYKLKLKNLGKASLNLLDKLLTDAKRYGFEFMSVNEYRTAFVTSQKGGETSD